MMTNDVRPRRPVKTSFIVGLGILLFLWAVMIVIANISGSSEPALYLVGALAGSIAYLSRRLGFGTLLAASGSLVLFILGFVTLSREGSRGDFFGVWFSMAVAALIVAGIIQSCRGAGAHLPPAGSEGDKAEVEGPVFRDGVKPRRIRDLIPADFPGADPQAFLAWQRAVKMSNRLLLPLVLFAGALEP